MLMEMIGIPKNKREQELQKKYSPLNAFFSFRW